MSFKNSRKKMADALKMQIKRKKLKFRKKISDFFISSTEFQKVCSAQLPQFTVQMAMPVYTIPTRFQIHQHF